MRKFISFCIILAAVMTIVPVFTFYTNNDLKDSKSTNSIQNSDTNEETIKDTSDENKYIIIERVLNITDETFSDEGLKAVTAVVINNASFESNENIITYGINSDLYKRIETAYTQTKVNIKHNGKTVYIPFTSLTNGNTKSSDKYPYIKSVASPWDQIDNDFVYGKDYGCGISIYGLNYLCENGLTYKEALKYYLPDFDIN